MKHGEERYMALTTVEGKDFKSSERATDQEAREDAAKQGFAHFTEQKPTTKETATTTTGSTTTTQA